MCHPPLSWFDPKPEAVIKAVAPQEVNPQNNGMTQTNPEDNTAAASAGAHTIVGVATSITAFLGRAAGGPVNTPSTVFSIADFENTFGALDGNYPMGQAVDDFFSNGGGEAIIVRVEKNPSGPGAGFLSDSDILGDRSSRTGMYALEKAGLFNLLCIPPDTPGGDTSAAVYQGAMQYCWERSAMLIVDPPAAWGADPQTAAAAAKTGLPALGLTGMKANAALYFPRVIKPGPGQNGRPLTSVPCGIIAGVIARNDAAHGVWSSPAGTGAVMRGVTALQVDVSGQDELALRQLGINCLRFFPGQGFLVWGARTLSAAQDFNYIGPRRLALYIGQSVRRGVQWAAFEPNAQPLWSQIQLTIGAFMDGLFRQGALMGQTPGQAYSVQCGLGVTMTGNDILNGLVNITILFAPLQPSEFVEITFQQQAGQPQP